MPMVMKSPQLKTYRGPKRKEQLGVYSLPGFYVPEVVGREFCLGAPDYSVVINNTLAIERRGGRGGGGTPMLVRSVGRDQRPWNKGLPIGQKRPLEPKYVWSIRVRLEIARSWRDLVIFNLARYGEDRLQRRILLRKKQGTPLWGVDPKQKRPARKRGKT